MQYIAPDSGKDVAALLARHRGKAIVLAGGTDLLVKMKSGFLEPEIIVDIKKVRGISEIRRGKSGYLIGAAVPCAALAEHKSLSKDWPGVVEGAKLIGSDQIQARCTMVGNLCNGSPAADSVPALIAAAAKLAIVGPEGKRSVAVADFIKGPGKVDLKRGEFVEAIRLPEKPSRTSADAYLRFTPRTEMDIAVASAAVQLQLERGKIIKARVAIGAVAPTALLVPNAAKALIGTRLDDDALEAMAQACREAARPIDDKRGTARYRKQIVGVMARRAAQLAYQRAGGK